MNDGKKMIINFNIPWRRLGKTTMLQSFAYGFALCIIKGLINDISTIYVIHYSVDTKRFICGLNELIEKMEYPNLGHFERINSDFLIVLSKVKIICVPIHLSTEYEFENSICLIDDFNYISDDNKKMFLKKLPSFVKHFCVILHNYDQKDLGEMKIIYHSIDISK